MHALTFLGTGCGLPMVDRYHSSILLEAEDNRWLLDAGEPCSHRLKALGIPITSLGAVFISHGHSDHLSGLPMIIQGAWLEARTAPLPIYLPEELIEPVRGWLEAVYLPTKLIGFPVEFFAWEQAPRGTFCLDSGRLHVATNPSTHLDGLRTLIDPGATERFRSYSIALDWPQSGKRLIYSADLGVPQDMEGLFTLPADLLICEMAHFLPEELFEFLRDKPVRRICLTHLTAEFGAQVEQICALGARMLPKVKSIQAMRDGERVKF